MRNRYGDSNRVTVDQLDPGDLIVCYREEGDGSYHWAEQPTRRRVAARVVETFEHEGTGTPGEMVERDGSTIYVLGSGNRWSLRFFIGEDRYTQDDVTERHFFDYLPLHHPVCIECAEPWPCREQRIMSTARMFGRELDDVCAHCGKRIGSATALSFHDGVARRRYHRALKYRGPDKRRCKDAAVEAHAAMTARGGSADVLDALDKRTK